MRLPSLPSTTTASHTVEEMEADLRGIYAQRGKPVFLQEWGDYWNQGMDANQRLNYLNSMYTMLGRLVAEGILIGFGYWGAWINSAEGLLASETSLNDRGLKLKEHFGTTSPTVDTTPPTVSISAPANGSTVSGTVTITATASDNVGVVGVQFKIDGVNFGSEDLVLLCQFRNSTSLSLSIHFR
jgi:hypothetical protein